jgi:transposase
LCAIKRKKGYSIKDISEIIEIPISTVSDYLKRFDKNLNSLYDNKSQSRPSKLNKTQQKILIDSLNLKPEKFGYNTRFWTTKIIKHYINKKFKKSFSSQGIRKMLKRNGCKYYKISYGELEIIKNQQIKKSKEPKIKKISIIDRRSNYWKFIKNN